MKKPFIICACLCLTGCSSKEETAPSLVVEVRVARAEAQDLRVAVRAPATIFPRQQANIAARVTAPIRTLQARKGDSVQAGQVLALLDDSDLQAQRKEAAAAVVDAEASLQKISAGTLPADVERARGQLAIAEASLNQAQKIYDRRSELFKEGAIPNRDLLVSQTDLAQARATHGVARKSLDLLESQSQEKDIRIAQSRLDQARARLELLDSQLQFTRLRSPFGGSVTEQFVFAGDMARPDTPLFTVADLSVAVARAQVPEAEAGAVRIGQQCVFTPADSPGSAYGGRTAVVNRAVDVARRTLEVWCEIAHPDRSVRAGAFGSLMIVTGIATGSILAPLPAVQFAEGTSRGFVMVVDGKKTAHKREVETGETSGNKIQILKGLAPGEMVIVEGAYGLPDGAEIRIAEEKTP